MAYSRKLEALAEAIAKMSGYTNPDSPAHAARNPGDLEAISVEHSKDARGRRVFHSFLDGYQALLHDLQVKISGKSRSGLTGKSTLADLAKARGEAFPLITSRSWASFLRPALSDPTITNQTQLSYFTE
jgi:hypothetical protein